MPTVFILGPSLENVTEPEPAPPPAPGRVGVEFADPATSPGGVVHARLTPGSIADALPLNVYAFYVNPPSSVPDGVTADWYFKSGAPSGSVSTAHAPEAGFDIVVPGVQPGVYHVRLVLEYAA